MLPVATQFEKAIFSAKATVKVCMPNIKSLYLLQLKSYNEG